MAEPSGSLAAQTSGSSIKLRHPTAQTIGSVGSNNRFNQSDTLQTRGQFSMCFAMPGTHTNLPPACPRHLTNLRYKFKILMFSVNV